MPIRTGLSCPLGAHIRRANPRTGDAPGGRSGPIDDLLVTVGLTTRHLRRADFVHLPWPRNTTVWPFVRSEDDAIASARFHRILRRGREYGQKIDRRSAARSGDARPTSRSSLPLPQRQYRPPIRIRSGGLDRQREVCRAHAASRIPCSAIANHSRPRRSLRRRSVPTGFPAPVPRQVAGMRARFRDSSLFEVALISSCPA